MSIRFPYLPPLGVASPAVRYRPMVPVTVVEPDSGRFFHINEAILDTGADDTVLPFGIATNIGVSLPPFSGIRQRIIWRGLAHPFVLADVELIITDNVITYRWRAKVAFSTAQTTQPILGRAHCLDFFNATFRGADRVVELAPNASFSGTVY